MSSVYFPFSNLFPAKSWLIVSGTLILGGATSCFGQTNSAKQVTPAVGEVVYQGIEGTFDFRVPDERQPTHGGLSATVTFNFLVKPRHGVTLKVLPEKSQLLMVQSDEGDEWRMQPEMMKSPKFSNFAWAQGDMRVFLKLPLKVGKQSNLTVVSGQIAVEVKGANEMATTGALAPVKDLRLKLGNDGAVVEGTPTFDDGRQVIVIKADAKESVWLKSRYKPVDPTAAQVKGEIGSENRVIFMFPSKVPKGEFVAETGQQMGEANIPFTAVVPNRNLFGMLAGLRIEPIPDVKGEPLKPGQQNMPTASEAPLGKSEPVAPAAVWEVNETVRFTVENITDTHMPGDFGSNLQVWLRNDVKITVLEVLPQGGIRMEMTIERVRQEETDDGEYRVADTRDDAPEKRESNPWSRIVGRSFEIIYDPKDGSARLADKAGVLKRLAGSDAVAAMAVDRLLKPSDLAGLVESIKPRLSRAIPEHPGTYWKEEMNPRIPLSDIRLTGEERVSSAGKSRVLLDGSYQLAEGLPAEQLVGQQLEFKMVNARYKQIDVTRSLHWDPKQKTGISLNQDFRMVLEGRLNGKPLVIRSTQKAQCWLLERTVGRQ